MFHYRFKKLYRNIVMTARTIVSKVQNNLLNFIVGGIVDGKCVGIGDPLQQPGVILETEDSVRKIQKGALFHYKKVKKGTPNLTSPYVHSFFTLVLIRQFFEKNTSSRAASGSRTQFLE